MTRGPQYDVVLRYTRGGVGAGIALYEYEPFSLLSRGSLSVERRATMAFTREGGGLLVAQGDPSARLDSGYNAEDWHPVREPLYEDSPEDGAIEDALEEDHPGLLDVVRGVLDTGRSHRLALLTRAPIRVPKRGRARPVTRAGGLVRAFLGLRGEDPAGHRVIVHGRPFTTEYGARYLGTVVYEGRSWTYEFQEWYDLYLEETQEDEPQVDVLSSYEVAVLTEPLR